MITSQSFDSLSRRELFRRNAGAQIQRRRNFGLQLRNNLRDTGIKPDYYRTKRDDFEVRLPHMLTLPEPTVEVVVSHPPLPSTCPRSAQLTRRAKK